MDKIRRIEMVYSSKVIPFDADLYAMMLFGMLEDLNNHKSRFEPYLAKFPVTSEEYELRIMLPAYEELSSTENPKLAFIFNIGDTIFLAHREETSKSLRVYKEVNFGEVIDKVHEKSELEKDKKHGFNQSLLENP